MKKINEINNIYGDNIAKVEQYDFSTANRSEQDRTLAITTIATVCTQSLKAIGSEKLCTMLLTEAHGIPSSAYSFVPVLIDAEMAFELGVKLAEDKGVLILNIFKYGQFVGENNRYLLTNLRALINDVGLEESKNYFNTDEKEIAIIKENFKVFKHKMDIRTARQFMRHSIAVWQEMSRRYVSDKKVPFEFYISDKWKKAGLTLKRKKQNEDKVALYEEARSKGLKPQDARDCLGLDLYTEIWSGWQPFSFENMIIERTSASAQDEIKMVARAMKKLTQENI